MMEGMKKKDQGGAPKRLEKVEKKLYNPSWKGGNVRVRPVFYSRQDDVKREWSVDEEVSTPSTPKKRSGVRTFFVMSVVFFIATVGVAAYVLSGGGRSVSSERIDIAFEGPVSVNGGNDFSVTLSITNNNVLPLEWANIVITYPPGFHAVDDVTGKELTREYRSIGSVASGETKKEIIKGVLFGGEGTEKAIQVSMEYGVSNSNAAFMKDASYVARIDSAPIAVSITGLTEINTGDEMDITVRVRSNSNESIKDVSLLLDYPSGFTPSAADPIPTTGSAMWYLGDIVQGEEKEIKIRGTMIAQDNDERTFYASVGVVDTKDEDVLGVVYNEQRMTVVVKDLFLGVQLAINNSMSDNQAISPESTISGVVTYRNNLPVPITDVEMWLDISGSPIIDTYTMYVSDGYYESGKNRLIWNKTTENDFSHLEPGESGSVTFSFDFLPFITSSGVAAVNPSLTYTIGIRAARVEGGTVVESRENALVRTMRVSSDIRLSAQSAYTVGPFTNSGPLPPQVEEETTYTITWSVVNGMNDVRNATVTGVLPMGVEWKGNVSPSHANVLYNAAQREVEWSIGLIKAKTGVESAGPTMSFQVGLTPSASQVTAALPIVTDIVMRAYDAFINNVISESHGDVSTELKGDPAYRQSWARVVK
jgi:hypothetical protein